MKLRLTGKAGVVKAADWVCGCGQANLVKMLWLFIVYSGNQYHSKAFFYS